MADSEFYRGKCESLETGIRALIEHLQMAGEREERFEQEDSEIGLNLNVRIAEFTPKLSGILDINEVIKEDPTADNISYKTGFAKGKGPLRRSPVPPWHGAVAGSQTGPWPTRCAWPQTGCQRPYSIDVWIARHAAMSRDLCSILDGARTSNH